ncbi:indolepyruvate ferredoxin oxidoreductase [Candidatus Thorarchaeota archaeon]|nr:MAG: indolepyruvate ferredoxin oxidoreductase [Candidatus Thorarchaeota archaeon]
MHVLFHGGPQMDESKDNMMLSGNEAIARGALEAGIGFCASYPGTPSTEITSTLMKSSADENLYVEWSINEKVALEACAGVSWMGVPAICPMKSLGLNVAADFLLNLNLSGTGEGGLVVVVCDDPRGHSSSNEQDSRFYSKASYLPLLEPTGFQQAKDVIPFAFELSRKYEIPVLVRSTTRLSHSRGIVRLGELPDISWELSDELPSSLYNVPKPHLRHRDLLNKLERISDDFTKSKWNIIEDVRDADVSIIASGICRSYAKEAIRISETDASLLSLVTTHPLPASFIREYLLDSNQALVIEEVDPFIEDAILRHSKSMKKVDIHGKRNGVLPLYGEMDADKILLSMSKIGLIERASDKRDQKAVKKALNALIPRPLTFCPGCTHRNVFWAIRQVRKRFSGKLVVAGDIGCYSLGVFYGDSMNTMQAMGSGIGTANGLGQLHRFGIDSKVIAVAGDSTFFHACIPALINARHKGADATFLILDNSSTAMTGFQPHPGILTRDEDHRRVTIASVVNGIGVDLLEIVDSNDISLLIDSIHNAVQKPGIKVLITKGVCRLEEGRTQGIYDDLPKVRINKKKCRGDSCRLCVSGFGCVALAWDDEKGYPKILDDLCIRCGACVFVCPHDAIEGGLQ